MNFDMKLLVPVLVVLGVIIAIVILFLLIRAILRRRRRVKEIGSLRDDLMVWRNLSSLVQGGKKADQVKASLSSRIALVRQFFERGLSMLDETRGTEQRPWFVLVGEPKSGKTTLMARSGVDLRPSVEASPAEECPLVCWLGSHSFTIDVSGRIFFDRWLEGSGAEWTAVLRMIRRRHRRRPLDGIILVIPADALIADDEALIREKTSVIGADLHRLLTTVGMNLPCHVIVTKSDMICGWREFFAGLSPEERESVFGWRNRRNRSGFAADDFHKWFRDTVTRFKEASVARMLQPGREGAARAYLLPDSFRALEAGLNSYLDRIFGADAWSGHDRLVLSGVFFTSAEDTGVVLSGDYAKCIGQKPDECPIATAPDGHGPSCFVKSLLRDFVFPCPMKATFTGFALFRRQLWGYIAAALVAVIGMYWVMTAHNEKGRIAAMLKPVTDGCHFVEGVLSNGRLEEAPVCEVGTNGTVIPLHEMPFPADPRYTRLRFMHNMKLLAEADLRAPIGYRTASLLFFGLNPSMGVKDRRFIFNRVQSEMVYMPVIKSYQKRALAGLPGPFSILGRQAFFGFNSIAFSLDDEPSMVSLDPILLTLFPSANPDVVRLFSQFYPDEADNCDEVGAMLVLDWNYPLAQKRLLTEFLADWENLRIYPETVFPCARSIIDGGKNIEERLSDLSGLTARLESGAEGRAEALAGWREISKAVGAREQAVAKSIEDLSDQYDFSEEGRSDPVDFTAKDIQRLLNEDETELSRDFKRYHGIFAAAGGNAYSRVGLEHLEESFKLIHSKLDAEIDRLHHDWGDLCAKRLFEPVDRGEKSAEAPVEEPVFVYSAIGELNRKAVEMSEPAELASAAEFTDAWQKYRERQALEGEKFEAIAKSCALDRTVSDVATSLRPLIAAQCDANIVQMLRRYVELHPTSAGDMAGWVASRAKPDDLEIPRPLAEELFGELPANAAYNPEKAAELFNSFMTACQIIHPPKKEAKEGEAKAAPPPDIPGFSRVEDAMKDYLSEFIRFWGGYADSLAINVSDWDSFRRFSGTVKPYAVNGVLVQLYNASRQRLRNLPDGILDPDLKKLRDDTIVVLNARLQVLGDPGFPRTCQRMTGAWSVLPVAPALAYKRLRDADAKLLMTDYFPAWAVGTKSDIPWWSRYCDTGLALVKLDARKAGLEMLRRGRGKFLRYPVCKDPIDPEISTEEDLLQMKEILLSCGFRPLDVGAPAAEKGKDATAEKSEKNEADERGSILLAKVRSPEIALTSSSAVSAEKFDPTWGDSALSVVEAIIDNPDETIWTLSVPSLATRMKLTSKYMQDLTASNYRYRYGRVTVAGELRGQMVALDGNEEEILARGSIVDGDIVVTLSAFSDLDESVAEKRFNGRWAIARLYNLPGSVFEGKNLFVPIIVSDRFGVKSVFWVKFAFNRGLPKPGEWPSVDNWLDMPRK